MPQLSEIQKEIQTTLEEFKSLQSVSAHVNETDTKLKEAYVKLKALDKIVDKELKDIEDLEGIGLRSLFHKTLGDKDKQLDKERQEYLEATLKYNEYKKSVDLMEYERDLLAKKLNRLPNLKSHLEKLKAGRAKEIMNSNDSIVRDELNQVLHNVDVSGLLNQELKEAMVEGEKALKLLKIVIDYLRKAGEWGRWDMYGDNRRADYMKRQSIDRASRHLTQAQHALNLFSRELRDLGDNNVTFNMNMIKFNKFTDFFFDNLISDWIVQQRIKSTLHSIESTYDHVKRILMSLQQEKQTNDKKLMHLEDKKDQLLMS